METENTLYQTVANLLSKAQHPLFITGAGISADSGLPTYRGIGGLYEEKHTKEGIPIETALSGDMLRTRPELTWKYLLQIHRACAGASFNRAHEVIAEIEQAKPDTWVLTQNVDGFHRDAGTRNLIEIHGRTSELYCMDCSLRYDVSVLSEKYGEEIPVPPTCTECNGVLRPDAVLFGEMLPEKEVTLLQNKAVVGRDIVFIIGTTAVFPYISQPVLMSKAQHIPTVEINPAQTIISDSVDYVIRNTASNAMNRIWNDKNK
jgi:NAD-dependent deacetylase